MHWNSPTCICHSKKFSGAIPPDSVLKRRGGKAKGRLGLEGIEGREWEGKKDKGEGKEEKEGSRGKGGMIVKAGAPLNENSGDATVSVRCIKTCLMRFS
jgi:hypothetical protein